nr:SURF1 family protein [Aurantiacibacter rhizosphaerae]
MVFAAAAVMVALGIWQLGRMDEKEALIAQYRANQQLAPLRNFNAFPASGAADGYAALDDALFRTVQISCANPADWKGVAGRNESDQSGYVHMFVCDSAVEAAAGSQPLKLYATIGWSRSPEMPDWNGGTVTGILSTAGNDYEVVASEPAAGLEPLARPDPADLPNNHLAYAGQWFFFALTALVIYWLALRARWRDGKPKRN